MKKLFLAIAVSAFFIACGGSNTETSTDNTPQVESTDTPPVDSMAAPVDSMAAPVDSMAIPPTE